MLRVYKILSRRISPEVTGLFMQVQFARILTRVEVEFARPKVILANDANSSESSVGNPLASRCSNGPGNKATDIDVQPIQPLDKELEVIWNLWRVVL
jgi:hypothetical protein